MKKRWKTAIAGVLVGAFLFVGVGCAGMQGESGKSAYQIAVEHGFIGSEAEWLASLKADNTSFSLDEIYASAVEHGFDGDYLEFLAKYLSTGGSTTVEDHSAQINKALTSVVSVYSKFEKTVKGNPWFGREDQITTYYSAGSGVVYQRNGGDAYIITNYHVVFDVDSDSGLAKDVYCNIYGQESALTELDYNIPCTYVGGSMSYDLAVLKVKDNSILRESDTRAVEFANSNEVVVGENVFTAGNPASEGISVCQGIVSVDSEYITMTAADDRTSVTFRVMRTDATINQGNSGGGLFNAKGELLGIVNAKIISSGVENIGYAIPSNLVKNVVENIIANCDGETKLNVYRGYAGMSLKTSSSKAVYDAEKGVTKIVEQVSIATINQGSLAEGKFKVGDIIVSLTKGDETFQVTRLYQVIDVGLTVRVGDKMTYRIIRDGEYQDVEITYTENSFKEVA